MNTTNQHTPAPVEDHKTASIHTDPYFLQALEESMAQIENNRRIQRQSGKLYKRDWYDRMSELGKVNAAFFIQQIEDVWKGTSELSSEMRNVILFICDGAIRKAMLKYANQPKPNFPKGGI